MRRKTCARHGKSRWKIVTFRLISSNVPPLSLFVPLLPRRFLFCTRRVCCNHQPATPLYLPTPLATIVALSPFPLSPSFSLSLSLSIFRSLVRRYFHVYPFALLLSLSRLPLLSSYLRLSARFDGRKRNYLRRRRGTRQCRTAMEYIQYVPFRHREFPSRVSLYLCTN